MISPRKYGIVCSILFGLMQYARQRPNENRPDMVSFSNLDCKSILMSVVVPGRPTFQCQNYRSPSNHALRLIDGRFEYFVFKYCSLSCVRKFLQNNLENLIASMKPEKHFRLYAFSMSSGS